MPNQTVTITIEVPADLTVDAFDAFLSANTNACEHIRRQIKFWEKVSKDTQVTDIIEDYQDQLEKLNKFKDITSTLIWNVQDEVLMVNRNKELGRS